MAKSYSILSKVQEKLLKGYAGPKGYGSPEANTSLQNMLTGGMETGGFRDTDIAAMEQANTAMAKTNLADMLGQTRAGSARSGTFFSTASRGKEADQARRAAEALNLQNMQTRMQAKQFGAGLDEAAKSRIISMLQAGSTLAGQ